MQRTLTILVFLFCLSGPVAGDTPELEANPAAELFVRTQVRNGEPADLAEAFPKEADRVLGSDFLYDLLTKSGNVPEIHRHGVRIAHATFPEDVDLINAEVPVDVELTGCHFIGDVELSQSHFKKNLVLDHSQFDGILNFINALVDGDLKMSGAKFVSTDGEADFEGLRIGGVFDLHDSVFAGNAHFIRQEIGGDMDAQNTHFTNPQKEISISFDSIKVNGYALFKGSEFSSSANFAYAKFAENLGAEGARFGNAFFPNQAEIIFNSMKVGRNAFFHETVFNGWVDFGHAEIGGNFEPTQAHFNSPYNLTNFTGLKTDVADFRAATFKQPYLLDAMSYRELKADSPRAFVDGASYSPDAYANLESFLKRQGMEGSANTIYIAQRRRERSGLSLPGKIGSLLLDLLVGYGRRPWLAFLWGAIFIAIGWLVFRQQKDMEAQKPEYENRPYSAFWYSLDVFLPFVDLQAAGLWTPRRDRRFARTYVAIHTLLGWILIPIGLAAVSGLIK